MWCSRRERDECPAQKSNKMDSVGRAAHPLLQHSDTLSVFCLSCFVSVLTTLPECLTGPEGSISLSFDNLREFTPTYLLWSGLIGAYLPPIIMVENCQMCLILLLPHFWTTHDCIYNNNPMMTKIQKKNCWPLGFMAPGCIYVSWVAPLPISISKGKSAMDPPVCQNICSTSCSFFP